MRDEEFSLDEPETPPDGDTPKEHSLVESIRKAIDEALPTEFGREHMGMSGIGNDDDRTLWLQFRWCLPPQSDARIKRILHLGHAIEPEVVSILQMIPGLVIRTVDTKNKQFGFQYLGGHFGGSVDFVARNVPGADPFEWFVGEVKGLKDSEWKKLNRGGLQAYSDEYWHQIHCYLGASKLKRALWIAYNKNTSQIYLEIVEVKPQLLDACIVKADRIITAPEPPISSFPNRNWYRIKNFKGRTYQRIYWGDILPKNSHCRNCRFSKPVEEGWDCEFNKDVPYRLNAAEQRGGCKYHNWIPALVPAHVKQVYDECVEYQTGDMSFWNVSEEDANFHQQTYTSSELSHLSVHGLTPEQLLDPVLQGFRQAFDATIIDSTEEIA